MVSPPARIPLLVFCVKVTREAMFSVSVRYAFLVLNLIAVGDAAVTGGPLCGTPAAVCPVGRTRGGGGHDTYSTCVNCGVGNYSGGCTGVCSPCPCGKYASSNWSSSCDLCAWASDTANRRPEGAAEVGQCTMRSECPGALDHVLFSTALTMWMVAVPAILLSVYLKRRRGLRSGHLDYAGYEMPEMVDAEDGGNRGNSSTGGLGAGPGAGGLGGFEGIATGSNHSQSLGVGAVSHMMRPRRGGGGCGGGGGRREREQAAEGEDGDEGQEDGVADNDLALALARSMSSLSDSSTEGGRAAGRSGGGGGSPRTRRRRLPPSPSGRRSGAGADRGLGLVDVDLELDGGEPEAVHTDYQLQPSTPAAAAAPAAAPAASAATPVVVGACRASVDVDVEDI